LETALTPTPQFDAGTVYRAQASTEGGDGSPPTAATAEEWIANTGSPANGDSYVQWLNGPSDVLDAWGMQQRYTAGRRNPGVNLVDDRLSKFDDGRISYLSCFDDDLLVISQWGDHSPRWDYRGSLTGHKALSKILTPSALGNEFEAIDDAVVDQLDEKAGDIIRWGHQIGWFSEDEEQYDDWKDRISTVRNICLEKVGELQQ